MLFCVHVLFKRLRIDRLTTHIAEWHLRNLHFNSDTDQIQIHDDSDGSDQTQTQRYQIKIRLSCLSDSNQSESVSGSSHESAHVPKSDTLYASQYQTQI
uniref:AlNc14C30G2824 protein n=1 Tax=Albugo laibachii Nc14 TaxID=890382 RepID=F0W7L8_9STRA|nr:AlNc14C30G2824 [Albugo laibachii Nc14]|eukprot:CCA17119.1 AlNc14C30G2824 [Albugo laibachii Nc14]